MNGTENIPDPDRWIRRLMYAVVISVGGFAAVVSFSHIYDLGRRHGQFGTAGRLLPLSVDGLIVAASLIMLISSRRTASVHWLPRLMLWLGIGATVGANIAYGIPYGLLGATVSAWPAVAFVGSVEMVMVAVRPGSKEIPDTYVSSSLPAGQPAVPANAHGAAEIAHAASVAGGNPLTGYQLHKRFGIPRSAADKIVTPPVVAGAGSDTRTALATPGAAGADLPPAVPAALNGNGSAPHA